MTVAFHLLLNQHFQPVLVVADQECVSFEHQRADNQLGMLGHCLEGFLPRGRVLRPAEFLVERLTGPDKLDRVARTDQDVEFHFRQRLFKDVPLYELGALLRKETPCALAFGSSRFPIELDNGHLFLLRPAC